MAQSHVQHRSEMLVMLKIEPLIRIVTLDKKL